MSNLQDLMSLVTASAVRPTHKHLVCIRPTRGQPVTLTVRCLDANRLRLAIARSASKHFPHGFTFSVRPA